MLLDSIHNLFSKLVQNVLKLIFYNLFAVTYHPNMSHSQTTHSTLDLVVSRFNGPQQSRWQLPESQHWAEPALGGKRLLAQFLKFTTHQKWATFSEEWSQNIYFQLAPQSKTHWNAPFIPSSVILFSNRATEFMGNWLRGYLRSRQVTEKRD